MNMYSILLKIIFVISLFILLFISSISYKHANSLEESTKLLSHSYKVQIQLEQIQHLIKDAETGQRGYIITHDSTFLTPYFNGYSEVAISFATLKELTANQPYLHDDIDELKKLIDLRFTRLSSSLLEFSDPQMADLLAKNMLGGKGLMNNINSKINQIRNLETTNFNNYQKKYEKEILSTPLITLMLLLFTLFVFVISFIRINKDLNIVRKSNEELLISTESIKQAEIIGEFCISIWNLKTDKIIYSDNLYRLLGCEPQSFEPTIENFLKFVHPDDRQIITNGVDDLIIKHETYSRYYRIIRNDGQERFF